LGAQTCATSEYGTSGFWASSYGTDEVFRYDAHGNFLGAFSHAELDGPRSLTVNPSGDIYVASQLTDEVHVFDDAGSYLRSFTGAGLAAPTGGAIGPNGDYYICSFNSDEVYRFDGNESVIDVYTSPGLNGPNCIVFLPDDSFVVTGQFSNDVHRFDATGNPISSYPTGQLSVMGAALDMQGRLLTAAGSSNDIGVFDCAGIQLETWPLAGGPQSIAIREDGAIFVTTYFTDEVVQLASNGDLVSTFSGGDQMRGIEFFPAALPEFERGDVNRDASVDVSDAIAALSYLFTGGEADCLDAVDANDDGTVDLADPIGLLAFLFQSGPVPRAPFGAVGVDPTSDDLRCLSD